MVAAAYPCPEGLEGWSCSGGGWKMVPLAEGAGEEGVEVGRMFKPLLVDSVAAFSLVPLMVEMGSA